MILFYQFYDYCETWEDSVEDNPNTHREQDLFESTEHVRGLMNNVNQRLGFTISISESDDHLNDMENLSFEDVQLIYNICRYEAAWHPQDISYWCSAFSEEDLRVGFILKHCNISQYITGYSIRHLYFTYMFVLPKRCLNITKISVIIT